MVQGGVGEGTTGQEMEKRNSPGPKPTSTLPETPGTNAGTPVFSPSGGAGSNCREPQENKGLHLCPGSQPNLQDEYVFISQKFLLECAKAFFPLRARQTRQVCFG